MISSKIFKANGSGNRFLSDFIIRSDQFCRVYAYKYDATLQATESHLEDDTSVWSYPDNLYVRGTDIANSSEDIITLEKFDLVDNSIVFYAIPNSGTSVYLEVATTSEEFGDTLAQPSQAERAALIAQAEAMTSESYAIEPEFVFVKDYYVDSTGTILYTVTTDYSSLHYSKLAEAGSTVIREEVTIEVDKSSSGYATADVAMDIKEYISGVGQTDFELKYGYDKVMVYLNGINLIATDANCNIDDYALTPTGISLTLGATEDDNVRLVGFDYQGTVRGTLFPMMSLFPHDRLYPTDGGCFNSTVEEAPIAISNFSASDGLTEVIQFTWTMSYVYPTVKYDLYDTAGLVSSNIVSGHTIGYVGNVTTDFYIVAYNTIGSVTSNTDSGSAVTAVGTIIPTAPTNVVATDDECERVSITFNISTQGYPVPTYNLLKGGSEVATDITSGYIYLVAGGDTSDYAVRATNSEGNADSTTNSGTSVTAPPVAEQCLPPSDCLIVDVALTPKVCTTDSAPNGDDFTLSRSVTPNALHLVWTNPGGTPTPVYDLWEKKVGSSTFLKIGSDVGDYRPDSDDYYYGIVGSGSNPDYNDEYFVIATNSLGTIQSNTVTG